MKKFLGLAAVAAATLTVPATAATYDAFASFDGTQLAGNFYYGQSADTNSTFLPFEATSNCFIDGSTCLQLADNHDVPGVTKSTTTSFQYGTVNVPDDRLLLHPDSTGQYLGVIFIAPTDGYYLVNAMWNVQDINPTGVGVNLLLDDNLLPYELTSLGTIGAGNPSGSLSGTYYLTAGSLLGLTFDNAGNYFNDSTGLNFTVSDVAAVPEPATWGLMILGFGAVGGAMRRRQRVAVRFA